MIFQIIQSIYSTILNFENELAYLKNETYPSRNVGELISELNEICKQSKNKLKIHFKEYQEADSASKKSYYLSRIYKFYELFQILYHSALRPLYFSNKRYVGISDYLIIDEILNKIGKKIDYIISSSHSSLSFSIVERFYSSVVKFRDINQVIKTLLGIDVIYPFYIVKFSQLFKKNILFKSILYHELGHKLNASFYFIGKKFELNNSSKNTKETGLSEKSRNLIYDLVKNYSDRLEKYYEKSREYTEIAEQIRSIEKDLKSWINEIIADFIALKLTGIGYFLSLILLSKPNNVYEDDRSHPSLKIRIKILNELLKKNIYLKSI